MNLRYNTLWIIAALCSVVANTTAGQSVNAEFEVASVRPSPPLPAGTPQIAQGIRSGGPGTSDPERISYSRVPLQQLVMAAYGVNVDQLSGPEWAIGDDIHTVPRFDVTAKIPPGTTREQFGLMLQNLLKERFQFAYHRVTKEFLGYTLVVGKTGSKLRQAVDQPQESPVASPKADGRISMEPDKDGFPPLFPGQNMGGLFRDGRVRARFRSFSTVDLARQVSFALGVRVVDKTGLTGSYDFTLEFVPTETSVMVGRFFALPLAPGQAVPLNTDPLDPREVEGVPVLSSAFEKQLGLRLEKTKIPLEVLVIDHVGQPLDN